MTHSSASHWLSVPKGAGLALILTQEGKRIGCGAAGGRGFLRLRLLPAVPLLLL